MKNKREKLRHDKTRRLNRVGRTATAVLRIPRLDGNAKNTVIRITHKLRSQTRRDDSSCPLCKETGHNFDMVNVRIGRSLRALCYCICCGERNPH